MSSKMLALHIKEEKKIKSNLFFKLYLVLNVRSFLGIQSHAGNQYMIFSIYRTIISYLSELKFHLLYLQG